MGPVFPSTVQAPPSTDLEPELPVSRPNSRMSDLTSTFKLPPPPPPQAFAAPPIPSPEEIARDVKIVFDNMGLDHIQKMSMSNGSAAKQHSTSSSSPP